MVKEFSQFLLQIESKNGGSVAKSTSCSFRGAGFGSQHPRGGPKPSVTLVPGDWMPSLGC